MPFTNSALGLLGITGCTCNECDIPSCGSPVSSVHILLGAWESAFGHVSPFLETSYKELYPDYLGDMGYPAGTGSYLLEKTRERAFQGVELPIEYYRSYNTSHSLSPFFSKITDIPLERLKLCNETLYTSQTSCNSFVNIYGNIPGVVEVDSSGNCHALCHQERWMLTPACRHNPQACLPYITGGTGWNVWSILHKAVDYGMPLAVAITADYLNYLTLPHEVDIMFFWWFPDAGFVSLKPVEVIFPMHNEEEYAMGWRRSAGKPEKIVNYAWKGLAGLHGLRAKEVARRLHFTMQQVTKLLVEFQEDFSRTGLPGPEVGQVVACNWVRRQQAVWQEWIPLDTECPLGQGLSREGAFVASRAEASSCSWCGLGRYSAPLMDAVGLTHSCRPCPAGQEQMIAAQSSCEPCRPGHYKSEEGAERCQECPPGNATILEGQTACPACAPGRATSEPAQLTCQSCAEGTASGLPGALSCTFCERGTYADVLGAFNCSECKNVILGSTSSRGASRPSECVCPVGTFMKPAQGCVPCLKGLHCPGGNGEPLQLPGYWVGTEHRRERDYVVYMCRDSLECPAGLMGRCASGRTGTACNNCKDLHYRSGHGQCLRCQAGSAGPLAAILIFSLALFVALVSCTKADASKQHLTLVTTVLIAGQMVTTIQALSAMKQIEVTWPELLLGLLDVLSVIVLDLDWLRVPCLLSSDSPLGKFILKILAYPLFVLLLSLIFLGSKLSGRPLDKIVPINIHGVFLLVIYISMTLTVMLPFQCQRNPGGFLSMKTNPGVRCFDDPEHMALSVLAAFGILVYPVGIAAWVAYATFTFKATEHTLAGAEFQKRFRFLFARFKPDCYYFGLVFLIRNCLVASIPVLLVQVPVLQVMVMAVVLLGGTMSQVWFKPWRTWLPNLTDSVLGAFLSVMVTGVAALLDITTEQMATVIGVALVVITLSIFAILLLLVSWALYRFMRPKKHFGIFLCHHKAGTGSLCRLMKMILAMQTTRRVFLDSDHLDDLDKRFDIVRSVVANLVVVLSHKVLTSPWCAGEMVTACRNNIPMVPIACDDFESPDTALLHAIVEDWSDIELALLMRYDIKASQVMEAYSALTTLPTLRISRSGMESAMVNLAKRCKLPLISTRALRARSLSMTPGLMQAVTSMTSGTSGGSKAKVHGEGSAGSQGESVVITGLTSDSERLAGCEIMQIELQRVLEVRVAICHDEEQAAEILPRAEVVVILLANGLLLDRGFARILLQAHEQKSLPHFLPVVADNGFQFPPAAFFKQLEEGGFAGVGLDDGPQLSAAYKNFLSLLSRPFDPLQSQSMINVQVRAIATRVQDLLQTEHASCSSWRLRNAEHLHAPLQRSEWAKSSDAAKRPEIRVWL